MDTEGELMDLAMFGFAVIGMPGGVAILPNNGPVVLGPIIDSPGRNGYDINVR